jgi:hypothetical protein
MPIRNDSCSDSGSAQMKPGDRVVWLRSPGRSFLTGWRVQRIPGVIVRVCRRRIRLKVRLLGTDRLVNVSPENVICEEGS